MLAARPGTLSFRSFRAVPSMREDVPASDPQQPPQAEDVAPTRLDEFAAACPDWLFATDREMRLVYASDQLTRLAASAPSMASAWTRPAARWRDHGACASS
jgi:hypothetical protein